MWRRKAKAVTFSYDDGVAQDERLAGLFDRYGLRATFHINSAWLGDGRCLSPDTAKRVYANHEVAGHTLTHPHLERLTRDTVCWQIAQDKRALETLFGRPVVGFSYPFGIYNDDIVECVRESGLQYARTVEQTLGFALPKDPLRLATTCHHNAPGLPALVDAFLRAAPEEPMLLSVWGHSYEFDNDQNWAYFEDLLKALSGRPDVFYGTVAECLPG